MDRHRVDKYKVIIIGAGWAGVGSGLDELRIKPASHAEAVVLEKRAQLVAFVDSDTKALKLASRLHPRVAVYTDARCALDEVKPDIVIIATHPDTHCDYIKMASTTGVRAILCEKPISDNADEAREAVAFARKHRVKLFVNHIRRFDPLIRRFRDYVRNEYVQDTYIGRIISASAYYNRGLYHGGTHFIDFLMFFLGQVEWVSAIKRSGVKFNKGDLAADCFLGFKSGAVAMLQYYNSENYLHSDVSFLGEGGKIDFKKQAGLQIETTGTRSSPDYSGYRELDHGGAKIFGEPRSWFKPVIPHVIDCLDGKDEPVSTGEDALRVLEVIEAIEKSVKFSGKKVKI